MRAIPPPVWWRSQNGRIIGNILCGHDGRTGFFYHVCVAKEYRKHGIGYRMVRRAIEALQKEGVSKVSLIAFKQNQVGNAFWQGIGWTEAAGHQQLRICAE